MHAPQHYASIEACGTVEYSVAGLRQEELLNITGFVNGELSADRSRQQQRAFEERGASAHPGYSI